MVDGEQELGVRSARSARSARSPRNTAPHQGRAQHRPGREVERRRGDLPRQALRLHPEPLRRRAGERREVDDRQPRQRPAGDRYRRAVDHREPGAQHRVPPGDPAERAGQGGRGEGAAQAQGARHVVGRAPRLQAVEQPEALLGEREGSRFLGGGSSGTAERRRRRDRGRPHAPGEAGQGRRREDVAQVEVDAEPRAHAGEQPHRRERVAAEGEEVVERADPLPLQHLAPHRRESRLDPVARRHPGGAPRGADIGGERQGGERPAVELAAGGPRQGGQGDEERRHHRPRQPRGEVIPQLGAQGRGVDRRPAGSTGDQVGDQPGLARRRRARQDRRLPHRRVRRERRRHLRGLDPEAAQLHLVVAPADQLERAVRPPARQVAGAVEALPRRRGEGVGEEALGGQVRAADVAAGEPLPRQAELAHHPRRQRPQARLVEHVGTGAGDRAPDRRLARLPQVAGGDLRPRGISRGLGRPVEVEQAAPWPGPFDGRGEPPRQPLPGQADRPHPRRQVPPSQQLRHHRRHRVDQRHTGRHPGCTQREGVRHEDHRAAGRERQEDLEDREVEGDRGRGEHPGGLLSREGAASPAQQGKRPGMRNPHPLRPPRRPRGVKDISQAPRLPHRRLQVL